MSFFNNVDDIRLIEKNIQRLQGLEENQAKKMLKVFIEARKRIKAQLNEVTEGTFTEAQLSISMAQIDTIISSLESTILSQSALGFDITRDQSVDDIVKEIRVFSKEFEGVARAIPTDRVIQSIDSENLLLGRYRSSLNAYTASMRDYIQRELTQAAISSEPTVRAVNRMTDGLQMQEWKILRIARTELHNIYNATKNESMKNIQENEIPDLKKSLFHPMDSRTAADSKYANRLELVVDIDKPFKYNFKGAERVFYFPPDRPNDRSIIVPYRKEWDN